MIVSFDTGADYDIASEEYVTQGWGGRSGRLKSEIRPLIIYLCLLLMGANLEFRYDFLSMLYLFL